MDTNLKSILLVCKYAVPEMIKNGGGTIVNNASMAAYFRTPYMPTLSLKLESLSLPGAWLVGWPSIISG